MCSRHSATSTIIVHCCWLAWLVWLGCCCQCVANTQSPMPVQHACNTRAAYIHPTVVRQSRWGAHGTTIPCGLICCDSNPFSALGLALFAVTPIHSVPWAWSYLLRHQSIQCLGPGLICCDTNPFSALEPPQSWFCATGTWPQHSNTTVSHSSMLPCVSSVVRVLLSTCQKPTVRRPLPPPLF